MGRLTQYIGGQVVTDNNVAEERQFIVDLDASETRVDGNIYITASEIQNAFEITNYELTSSGSLGQAATSFNVRVTGDEGARFTIVGSNGASNVSQRTIDATGTDEFSVSVSQNPAGGASRSPEALLVLVPADADNNETVFADTFAATNPIVVSQAAGLLVPTCSASNTSFPGQTIGQGNQPTFGFSYNGDATTYTLSASSSGSGGTVFGDVSGPAPGGGFNFSGLSGSIGGLSVSSNPTASVGITGVSIPPNPLTLTVTFSFPATATYDACSGSAIQRYNP